MQVMDVFTNLIVIIFLHYKHIKSSHCIPYFFIMYSLNLYSIVCQKYLSKAGEKRNYNLLSFSIVSKNNNYMKRLLKYSPLFHPKSENISYTLQEFRDYSWTKIYIIAMSYNYAKGWAGTFDDIIFMTTIYVSIFFLFCISFCTWDKNRFFSLRHYSCLILQPLEVSAVVLGRFSTYF